MVSILFVLTAILPVYADEIDKAQEKLQDVSRQIEDQESQLKQIKQQENSIIGQLQNLEQGIMDKEQQIETLAARIHGLEKDINKTEEEIAEKEAELQVQVDYLCERLLYMYEDGMDVSYLEVLFSSTNIKDFLTRYDLLQYVVEQDMNLIDSINKNKRALDIKKNGLEIQKKELVTMREVQEAQRNQLAEQSDQKQEILANVRVEKKTYEKALAELERSSRELEELIRRSQSGQQLGTGIYTWPTPGYGSITSAYGMRYHPILKTNKLHTGVDVGAPMGAKIVAADSGKVIYAGWQGGYGQTIIIDHGAGMSTLYAHQSRFAVSSGKSVSKGDVIGYVGSTGWSTGPHLHFEVRINGNPTNPMSYLR
ncbi:MAG: peptidoglycan DD-metalloendopeptidase family protein [Syntrophomonadaceae bacterium]|jgi:murein DD-endopeptidase MepM/ murein hydrolase activator NlpD|nr:peptidoglycan DD-metalloendopeptidase family protein [Syntrophomonadaceae bacterium]